MEPLQFLEELKAIIGGNIVQEQVHGVSFDDARGLPHILVDHRGFSVKIDFIIKEELQFTVYSTPPRYLTIRGWTLFERILSWCCLLGATRFPVGDETRFFLLGISESDAAQYFTARRARIITDLFPFIELEHKEMVYRCLKGVFIGSDYTAPQAAKDLDLLLDYVETNTAGHI